MQRHGTRGTDGAFQTRFGTLFQETENIFEALTGLLITARKHKVVSFDGDMLFQGRDNDVLITLLKTEIPDSSLETYTYRQFRACSISHKRKGKGFKATSLQSSNAKCHVCAKTVYPMEFVSANELPMHKACFKCTDCKCPLTTSNYAALNNKFYCKTHYESNYKKRGSYVFEDEDQTPKEAVSIPQSVVTDHEEPATIEKLPSTSTRSDKELVLEKKEVGMPTSSAETSKLTDKKEDVADGKVSEKDDAKTLGETSVDGQPASGKMQKEEEEEQYAASIRQQESRTRDSISQKARKAAEKLGLDEPPDDPLEELVGEEKDKEKVMERRLSVVAQRSAKSKERAEAATKWLDKQIRMLIDQIKLHGSVNGDGQTQAMFGVLFQETENIFEALSGLLMTARKHKVVSFEGDMLFQGRDEKVVITLLKTEIADSSLDTYTLRQFRACSISHKRKGKGFKATSLRSANAKCHVCAKTVYPMEFVSANDLPMHKVCFRCHDCKCTLTTSNYAALNNKFYCKTHYESNYKKRGSYSFE